MKCPKCGFTSFDFLENCKKCGQELQGHKQKFGLRSVIFPTLGERKQPLATEEDAPAEAATATATTDSDFGFDFMSDETPATPVEAAVASPESAAAEVSESFGQEEVSPSATDEEQAFDEFSFDTGEDVEAEASTIEAEAVTAETEATTVEEEVPADAEGIDLADDFDFAAMDETVEETQESAPEAAEDDIFSFPEAEVETETEAETETGIEDDIELAAGEEDLDFSDSAEDLDFDEPAEDIDFDEPDDEDDLGGWDEAEETTADQPEEETTEESREPSDPFDLRGPAEAGRAPEPSETEDAGPLPELFQDEPEEAVEEAEPFLFDPDDHKREDEFPQGAVEEEPESETFPGLIDVRAETVEEISPATCAGDATEEPPGSEEAVLLAPRGARLAAGVCDLLILALVFVLFLAVGQQILHETTPASLLPDRATLIELSGPYFLVLFALSFGYFTLFHFLTGQTPGKMLFKLRVEDLAGQPLNFSQAFLRSVGGLFSLLPAGLGFLAICFSSSRRGWNDLLAGSRLVPVYDVEEEPAQEQDA